MSHLTYKTRLIFESDEDKKKVLTVLEWHKVAFQKCSKIQFTLPKNSIVDLHSNFYTKFRESQPQIPSQVVIRAEQEVLVNYRTIKSNKHKITEPVLKKNLSMQLDARIFSMVKGFLSIISSKGRVKCKFELYPKLEELLAKYKFGNPRIFEKDGDIWISLYFKAPDLVSQNKLACGIDLGIKNFAATSEGKLFRDKKFNAEKRRLRFLRRKLQSCGTKSAKRHLKKLRRKERNKNTNFTHCLANAILNSTKADTLVLENLKSLKVKKHKFQNKNRISQVPFFQLRQFLAYKAALQGKIVILACPSYTSQIDNRTNKRDGERKGSRYIGKDGKLLHSDVNAACNIALRSKLPCSISNYFAWQAVVTQPIVGGEFSQENLPSDKPRNKFRGQ